jgi:hypothetical protein
MLTTFYEPSIQNTFLNPIDSQFNYYSLKNAIKGQQQFENSIRQPVQNFTEPNTTVKTFYTPDFQIPYNFQPQFMPNYLNQFQNPYMYPYTFDQFNLINQTIPLRNYVVPSSSPLTVDTTSERTIGGFGYFNSANKNTEPIPRGKRVNVVVVESESSESSDTEEEKRNIILKPSIKKKNSSPSKCYHGTIFNLKKGNKCNKCETKICAHGIVFYKCTRCRVFCKEHSDTKIRKFNCEECQKQFANQKHNQKDFFDFVKKMSNSSENSE